MELLLGMLLLLPLPAAVVLWRQARERGERRSNWSHLDREHVDDCFRGYKVAQVIVGPNAASFVGLMHVAYGADGTAQCRHTRCTPPGLGCDCGFYAFRHRDRALHLLSNVEEAHPERCYALLTADLDGDVLEYEHGFRAERQRILAVDLDNRCHRCRMDARADSAATTFFTHPTFRGECSLATSARVLTALPMDHAPIKPLCAAHAPDSRGRAYQLTELCDLTGTEVSVLRPALIEP